MRLSGQEVRTAIGLIGANFARLFRALLAPPSIKAIVAFALIACSSWYLGKVFVTDYTDGDQSLVFVANECINHVQRPGVSLSLNAKGDLQAIVDAQAPAIQGADVRDCQDMASLRITHFSSQQVRIIPFRGEPEENIYTPTNLTADFIKNTTQNSWRWNSDGYEIKTREFDEGNGRRVTFAQIHIPPKNSVPSPIDNLSYYFLGDLKFVVTITNALERRSYTKRRLTMQLPWSKTMGSSSLTIAPEFELSSTNANVNALEPQGGGITVMEFTPTVDASHSVVFVLENLQAAEQRDARILIFGSILGAGVALLAETLTSFSAHLLLRFRGHARHSPSNVTTDQSS